MTDKKAIRDLIELNQTRVGKKLLLSESLERSNSVVMSVTPFDVKVALKDNSGVICIKKICILEGISSYDISEKFFNMDSFI